MPKLKSWRIFILFLLSILCIVSTYEVLYYISIIAIWEKIIIILFGLFLPYLILYWFANNSTLTRSKISAVILVVIALSFFLYAAIGIQIPKITYPMSTQETLQSSNGATIQFYAIMNFTTTGSFSVGNPIHVQLTIVNSSVPYLLNYIGVFSLTGAYNVPIVYNLQGGVAPAYFNLTQINQVGNGTYYAEGNFIWYQSINAHTMWAAPFNQWNGVFDISYWQNVGIDILDISPVSDSLTVNSNHVVEQLTWVLVGFAVIALQPILNALFPDKPDKKEATEDSKVPQRCPYCPLQQPKGHQKSK